jgi:hypothetical protein
VRAAGGVARFALDQAVHGHLRHPPPGGELAAGDRDHPRGGLIEFCLARDVHRLLGIARRDQRAHARERSRQIGVVEGRAEEAVHRLQQVVDVLGGGRHVVERAVVVVVGGADEGVAEPGEREDRTARSSGHDRAAHEWQIVTADGEVGAAAWPDTWQLRLVVQLLRAQLVRPHSGRVHHVCGAHLELRAALAVERSHAVRPAVALEQPRDADAVGAHSAEALGLAEHRQHQAHVVGLTVVEQVAARRLACRKRGQQLDDLLAGDDAVALRAPGLIVLRLDGSVRAARLGWGIRPVRLGALGPRPAAAARAQPLALDRHHVVEVQPHADHAVGTGAFEGGHDERERAHEMWCELDHQPALEQRLADQAEVEVLQVAQASVDELARTAGGPEGIVGPLEQGHAVAARGRVQGDAGAGDSAAHDDDVEVVARQRCESLAALDHRAQSRRARAQIWASSEVISLTALLASPNSIEVSGS